MRKVTYFVSSRPWVWVYSPGMPSRASIFSWSIRVMLITAFSSRRHLAGTSKLSSFFRVLSLDLNMVLRATENDISIQGRNAVSWPKHRDCYNSVSVFDLGY
jgi:hypothetical protein